VGATGAAVAVVLMLKPQVEHVEKHEARTADHREDGRNDAVVMLLVDRPTMREILEVGDYDGDEAQNVKRRRNIGTMPLDPVAHGDRTDDDGRQHKEDVDPNVSKEAKPQRTQKAQCDTGQDAVNCA